MNSSTQTDARRISRKWQRPKLWDAHPEVLGRQLLVGRQLCKTYRKAGISIPVLQQVDFEVKPGEFCAIVGQSGSGKSTLLHLLATLDTPDAGEIHYRGQRIDNLSSRGRDRIRNRQFGMIFQFYHLLPELTALENVMLPELIHHRVWGYWARRRQLRQRAEELLELVGLSSRLRHRPRELSGGEMQRTAIARALMSEPQMLFADEPTGNLDERSGCEIMELLHRLNQQRGLTIVMVTHDSAVAAVAHRIARLANHELQIETNLCP